MSLPIVRKVSSCCLHNGSAGQDLGSRVSLKRAHSEGSVDETGTSGTKHRKSDSDLPAPPATIRLTTSSLGSMRDLYNEVVRTHYPWYKLRNDFELLVLGGSGDRYAEVDGLGTRLAQDWLAFVSEFGGNPDTAMKEVRRVLDASVEVTGEKPLPGDEDVTIIPIPGSLYSLRMWPGAICTREFCLDYVYANDTAVPINKPPGYDLTTYISGGATPWLGVGGQLLNSLETNFSVRAEDIIPGEEKFVVLEGMTCSLEYPEQGAGSPVCFEVPVRVRE